ncbi:mitochondrial thiamine pyrophosphate transporter [Rhizina undulata]
MAPRVGKKEKVSFPILVPHEYLPNLLHNLHATNKASIAAANQRAGVSQASKGHTVLAGALTGLISRFIIAPLDVVKIRLQLQITNTPITLLPSTHRHYVPPSAAGPTYCGILPTMRTIIQQEGLSGLWKGNIPAELLYLTYGAVQFLAYRQANVAITSTGLDVPEYAKSFIAGAIGGATATTVTYPLDLLRTRFAAQGSEKVYGSLVDAVRSIFLQEGTGGFFRGLKAGVSQIVPQMGFFFGTYEPTRTYLTAHDVPPAYTDTLAGAFGAFVSKTGVFPLDLIRKRLQVQGPTRQKYVHRNIPVYVGVLGSARDIVKAEGLRGLYKGLGVSLVKAAPLSAMTMVVYERTLGLLEWVDPVEKQ